MYLVYKTFQGRNLSNFFGGILESWWLIHCDIIWPLRYVYIFQIEFKQRKYEKGQCTYQYVFVALTKEPAKVCLKKSCSPCNISTFCILWKIKIGEIWASWLFESPPSGRTGGMGIISDENIFRPFGVSLHNIGENSVCDSLWFHSFSNTSSINAS